MSTPHILLITHRRSGTHLTVDLLRNNFGDYGHPYISINEILKRNDSNYTSKLITRMDKTPRIFKSHSDINHLAFHRLQPAISEFYRQLVESAKIIYVYREPKDTLTSLYFHYLKYKPNDTMGNIDEFIFSKNDYHTESYNGVLNRVEYWKYHVEGWSTLKEKILFLRFENILLNYESSLLLIAEYLNSKPQAKIIDVRLNDATISVKKNTKLVKGNEIYYTTENFRGGEIGSYVKYLKDESITKIDKLTNSLYNRLIKVT